MFHTFPILRATAFTELGGSAQIKPGRAVYFDTSLSSLWVLKGVKRARKRIITLRFTFRVTPRVTRSYWEHKGCAWRGNGIGHGQNPRMGWSDPTFGCLSLANTSWGRSSPQRDFYGATLVASGFPELYDRHVQLQTAQKGVTDASSQISLLPDSASLPSGICCANGDLTVRVLLLELRGSFVVNVFPPNTFCAGRDSVRQNV